MHFSVRCHAVITIECIYKNAVISYDGDRLPMYDNPIVVKADAISVQSFTSEIHSTVDYNGIAVVGYADLSDIRLTADTLSSQILQIKNSLRSSVEVIRFIPLKSERNG